MTLPLGLMVSLLSSSRENWDLVKHDLLAFLNVFHGGTADIERINKAYLALLP